MPFREFHPAETEHREKQVDLFTEQMRAYACVLQLLTRSQWAKIPDAQKAVDDEFAKLLAEGAWDVKKVREGAGVREEARRSGRPVHVARVFPL